MNNILPCEQLSLDNNWSLTRKNACHIANQNAEMGEIRLDIFEIKSNVQEMTIKQDMLFWLNGIVVIAIIGALISIAVKKIFGKNNK